MDRQKTWAKAICFLTLKGAKGHNSKCIKIQELWFLHSAHRLMLVNIFMKFHEHITNGFQVTEWTPFCGGQTDNLGKNNVSPNPNGGDINMLIHVAQPEP